MTERTLFPDLFVHTGGCGWCTHFRRNRCHHPSNGVPLDYHQAREHGRPCGPSAALWERYTGTERDWC